MTTQKKSIRTASICYFIIMLCFAVIRMLDTFGLFSFLGSWWKVVFTLFVQIGLFVGVSIGLFSLLMKRKPRETMRLYGFKKISAKAVLISFCIGALIFVFNMYIAGFFNTLLGSIGFESWIGSTTGDLSSSASTWASVLYSLVMTCILPGFCEEVAHRGMLLKVGQTFGFWKAIIVTGLMFGLMHLNISQFFYASCCGMILAFVAFSSNSIWPSMIVHFTNNALNVLITALASSSSGFANFVTRVLTIATDISLTSFVFNLCVLGIVIILGYHAICALTKNTSLRDLQNMNKKLRFSFERSVYYDMVTRAEKRAKGEDVEPYDEDAELSQDDLEKLVLEMKQNGSPLISKFENEIIDGGKKPEKDPIAIAFFVATLVIGITVTIFTLVWGII